MAIVEEEMGRRRKCLKEEFRRKSTRQEEEAGGGAEDEEKEESNKKSKMKKTDAALRASNWNKAGREQVLEKIREELDGLKINGTEGVRLKECYEEIWNIMQDKKV